MDRPSCLPATPASSMEPVTTEVVTAMEVPTATKREGDRRAVPIVWIGAISVVGIGIGVAPITAWAVPMPAVPPTPAMAVSAVVNGLYA